MDRTRDALRAKVKQQIEASLKLKQHRLSVDQAAMRARNGLKIPRSATSWSWIYFIRCNEFVKIGYTYDIKERLAALSTANPYPLQLIALVEGSVAKERELHKLFSEHRTAGEWFRWHPTIETWLETHRVLRFKPSV